MLQDDRQVVPMTMAVLLHVVVFGSLLVAIDFGERVTPPMPLAIKGTLVTDNAIVIPPAPEIEDAPPPQPVVPDEERIRAEEEKRLEDQRIEQERLSRLAEEEAERKRQAEAEAERQRQAELEAERRRKAEEEAEKERLRLEVERQRQAEIERQRLENERLRAEAEAARRAELAAESSRLEAMQANAEAAYMFAIQQRISRNWVKPPTATAGIECVVNIRQLPGGEVVSVSLGACNGDSAVKSSIEAAVRKASPLPSPADPGVFDRDIRLIFRPEE